MIAKTNFFYTIQNAVSKFCAMLQCNDATSLIVQLNFGIAHLKGKTDFIPYCKNALLPI